MTNIKKRQIARASRTNLLAMVRVGFELETQEFQGYKTHSEEREFDDDARFEYEREMIQDELRHDCTIGTYISLDKFKRHFASLPLSFRELNISDLSDLVKERKLSKETHQAILDMISECIVDSIDEYPDSCYIEIGGYDGEELPAGLTWSEDPSVEGPEIKTEGPVMIKDAVKYLDTLYNQRAMVIDKGCSFLNR